MNLLVLVLRAHNILYICPLISVFFGVTLKKKKHNWWKPFTETLLVQMQVIWSIIAHVLIVWLFSQHGWGLHLCWSSWEKSADGTMPPPGSEKCLEPAQRLTNRDQIMITPWCCLHIPPSVDDTSAMQQQLTTKARWRQVLVLDPVFFFYSWWAEVP